MLVNPTHRWDSNPGPHLVSGGHDVIIVHILHERPRKTQGRTRSAQVVGCSNKSRIKRFTHARHGDSYINNSKKPSTCRQSLCICKAHVNLFHVVNTHVEREKVHCPGSLEGKITIRSIHPNLFIEHPRMHKHDLTIFNMHKHHKNPPK